jgi:hypothetical protein
MENTYSIDITFLAKVLGDDDQTWIDQDVTKKVTFKELDRRSNDQHLLHFLISTMISFEKGEGGLPDKIWIEYSKMHDLAKAAINTLMIVGDGVTEADKTQILADSFALINFSEIFSATKCLPFFLLCKKVGKAEKIQTQP